MFLLDTNVVSELVRRTPEQAVVAWVERQMPSRLFLSVVTLGELVRGVARLRKGQQRARLEAWVDELLPQQFDGRILPFDRDAAVIWGHLMGRGDQTGRPRAAIDAQIAAIALHHALVLVTRNTADFEGLYVRLLNPWP